MRIEGDAVSTIKPLLPANVQAFLPGPLQERLAASGATPSPPSLGVGSASPAASAAAPSMEDTIANRTGESIYQWGFTILVRCTSPPPPPPPPPPQNTPLRLRIACSPCSSHQRGKRHCQQYTHAHVLQTHSDMLWANEDGIVPRCQTRCSLLYNWTKSPLSQTMCPLMCKIMQYHSMACP